MAPFEALYGQPCRSPLCWNEVREGALLGPEFIRKTNEVVEIVRERLKAAQHR